MGLGAFYQMIDANFSQRPSPDGGANRYPAWSGGMYCCSTCPASVSPGHVQQGWPFRLWRRRKERVPMSTLVPTLPLSSKVDVPLFVWQAIDCRVRGRVLMAQEHQPLPSEPCWQFSLHTALQESLRRLSSDVAVPIA